MKNLYLILGWVLTLKGSDFILAVVQEIYTRTADLSIPPSKMVEFSFLAFGLVLALLPLVFGILSKEQKSTKVLSTILISVASIDLVAFLIKVFLQYAA